MVTRQLTPHTAGLIDAADQTQAVVIATGITEDSGREVLGPMVGDSETEVFRRAALAQRRVVLLNWQDCVRRSALTSTRVLSIVAELLADRHCGSGPPLTRRGTRAFTMTPRLSHGPSCDRPRGPHGETD
ncbi:hypothetical protein AB0L14_36465 [Streptomyces sp. NPDC052727]|uniref:hypothetical protein n=1 Tax=Streptomyces sp. NPDC052727 TaxID=3154854 RepID=UPI003413FA28